MTDKILLGKLIGLVRCIEGNESEVTQHTRDLIFGVPRGQTGETDALCAAIEKEKQRLAPDCYACATPCGKRDDMDFDLLALDDEDTALAKEELLTVLQQVDGRVPFDLVVRGLFLYGLPGAMVETVQEVCDRLREFAAC